MKTIKDFEKYFNEKYLDNIKLYEKTYFNMKNKNTYKNIFVFCIITIFLVFFLFLYKEFISFKFLISFIIFYTILSCLFFFLLKFKLKKNISYEINKLVFYDCLTYFSDGEKQFSPNKRISKDYFSKSNFFNLERYNYNGDNFSSIYMEKEKIIISDFNIYDYKYKTIIENFYENGKYYRRTINRKIPFDVFKGLYLEFTTTKSTDDYIYMISNDLDLLIKNKFNKLLKYDGVRVNLENLDFEKYYNVYADDEIKARCVFDLEYMEKLVSMESIIKQRKFLVYRPDGKVSLFISGFTIEDLLKKYDIFSNGKISYERLYQFFDEMSKIFDLVKIIK